MQAHSCLLKDEIFVSINLEVKTIKKCMTHLNAFRWDLVSNTLRNVHILLGPDIEWNDISCHCLSI